MLKIGQPEIDAVSRVLSSGKIFRYREGGDCHTFEQRYAKFLGGRYFALCASGTTALASALSSLGIGPGDEVIVPAHTYMATAIAVVNVGAIPVIVDIDDSIMISPEAIADAVGPRTRAVIPVHMWGHICDMAPILRVARKHKLFVIEDCSQAVGGAYRGRGVGSLGDAGCYSFNYFKNMTCGEGGGILSRTLLAHNKVRNLIDSCAFFWEGKKRDFDQFCAPSARVSDIEGAILHKQLDQLPGILKKLRRQKHAVLKAVARDGFKPVPLHSPDGECATNLMFQMPTAAMAKAFATAFGCGLCAETGRHTFTEWDPILKHRGHIHPKLNPFTMPANRGCRMTYSADMLPKSMDILRRTVMIGNGVNWTARDQQATIRKIRDTSASVLSTCQV